MLEIRDKLYGTGKRLLITLSGLFWLLSPMLLQAQNVQFGVQLAGGASSVYNFLPAAEKLLRETEWAIPIAYPNLSYGAAAYVSVPLNDNFYVATEPGFLRKGYTVKYVGEFDLIHNSRFIHYLQLPLLLEMRVDDNLWVSLGPELGWLLRAIQKNYDDPEPIDLMYYYSKNRLDAGLQAGAFYTVTSGIDVGAKLGASIKPVERFFRESQEHDVLVRITKRNLYLQLFFRIKL